MFIRLFSLIVLVFILIAIFFVIHEKEGMIITFFNNGEQVAQIEAQIAKTEAELKQGLMYVKSLPENKGILFIFPNEKHLQQLLQIYS